VGPEALKHPRKRPLLICDFAAKHASERPDKPAVICGDRSLSYGEIYSHSQRLAHHLKALGIGRGDRVAGVFYKSEEVILTFLAAGFLGALFVPVNYRLEPEHFIDLCRRLDMKVFLSHPDFAPLLENLASVYDPVPPIIYSGDRPIGRDPLLRELLAGPDPAPFQEPLPPDHPAYINFTSGSTGRPKGAIATHRNLAVNTRASIEALGLRPDDIHLGMFAVYAHPHELFYRAFFLGGTAVLLDSLSPKGLGRA